MRELLKFIKRYDIELIHAHYGLSGLLAAIQRKIPVVITFHGSDINQKSTRHFSKLASKLSKYNIVVEKSFIGKIKLRKNYSILPCGVDLSVFKTVSKHEARSALNINESEKIILFSSSFNNPVKNYPLAKEAADKIPGAKLVELAGYSREQVNLLMNAADILLMTSFNEGSPQVVKEALACNLPVVSTPVGDVPELLKGVNACRIVSYNSSEIASAIQQIISPPTRSDGNIKITSYDNRVIAKRLIKIYQSVLIKQNA